MCRVSWTRRIVSFTVAFLLLAWAAPTLLRVNYWKEGIAASLSQTLHRPVQIGDLRLKLLGGAGFQMDNVVVAEDPQFGVEPFARVSRIEAQLALRSLWHRRVEFASLTLLSPSINIVRTDNGHWNLESLRNAVLGSPGEPSHNSSVAAPSSPLAPPRVRVESGRLNFKSGNQKRSFRLDSFDLDLLPPSAPNQPWAFRMEGIPIRAGLSLPSNSRVKAQGQFGPLGTPIEDDVGIPLRADWRADQASLEDLLGLLFGDDFGVRADASFEGHLVGTTSLLRLSASAEIHNPHRWDLPAPSSDLPGGVHAAMAGIVDLENASLELTSLKVPLGEGAVTLRGRVEDLLGAPRSQLEATVSELPLPAVAEIARRFIPQWDSRIAVQGVLDGHLQTADLGGGVWGDIRVRDAALQDVKEPREIRFSDFSVVLQGRTGSLGPLDALLEQGAPIQVTARWDSSNGSSQVRLSAPDIPLPILFDWAQSFGVGTREIWNTAVERPRQGKLAARLSLTARVGAEPQMAGSVGISDAVFHFSSGLSEPVVVSSARLQFLKNRVQADSIDATLGALELRGSLVADWISAGSQSPALPAPHALISTITFRLEAPEVDIRGLSGLLPSPPQPSLFSWFAGEQSPFPSLAGWPTVRGTLETPSVRYGGLEWKDVAASISLHDQQVNISGFSGTLAGGTQQGSATISLATGTPAFALESRYANLDLDKLTEESAQWKGLFAGKLSGDLRLSTSGRSWNELLANWTGAGQATGRAVTIHGVQLTSDTESGPDSTTRWASFSSEFQIAKQQLRITEMTATPTPSENGLPRPTPPSVWRISGTVGFDRTLDLTVQPTAGHGFSSRIAGTLLEPRVSRITGLANATAPDASLARE